MLSSVIISEGGVMPNIHSVLLPKRTEKKAMREKLPKPQSQSEPSQEEQSESDSAI